MTRAHHPHNHIPSLHEDSIVCLMPLHMRTHPGPLPLDSHKSWHNPHINQKAIPSERTGGLLPPVVRGKHVSLELFALLGIFALHENFLGGLPSGRVTADGTLFLFPLQSAIPSHIHDRNVSYHISIMCFRTEVGNGRGEDHHTDFSGERSGPSSPVRPVKTPLQSVARLLGRGISLAGAQLGGKPRAPSPQFLQNTLNVNAYVNAEMLARKSRANPSNS